MISQVVTCADTHIYKSVQTSGLYDNAHANWTYAGSWMDWGGLAGAHSQTLSMTSDTNATATIQINGTAFRLRYTRFTNRGTLTVYVDGALIGYVSATGSLGWQTVYERRGLSPGVHTIQIRHGGGGGFIDVDAIEVFTPTIPAAVGVGVYDNAHPNWTYAGSWMDWAGQAGAHSQTLSMTSDTSATATIQINGTAFRLRYTRFTNRGSLLIFVDGVLVASQSAAGTLNWQTVLTWSGLTNGVHTIVIRHNGPPGSFIDVDAIDVL